MFTVVIDGNIVYDPDLTSLGNVIFSPRLTVGLNKSGEFSFVIPHTNPYYNQIEQISSRVFVLNNGSYDDVLFVGRVLNISIDFDKKKTVSCEGAMSYLVDSILRPYYFEGTPNDLFEYYVGRHNAIVDPDNNRGKRLTIGYVNVDSGTQIQEGSESYVSTIEELQTKLLNRYGGYIVTRWDNTNQKIVLDYISDIGRDNSQIVQYSRNLLDLVEEQPAEDIYTVAIPLGAQIFDEETGENLGRVSIADYPTLGNPDYLEASSDFINRFGRIEKTFLFDDIEDQAYLYSVAQYLVSFSALIPSRITVKAIDLNLVDPSYDQIKVGDLLTVLSQPHGVDRQMLCTGIDYDFFEPGNTVYEFEIETTYSQQDSLSRRQNDAERKIRTITDSSLNIIENAIEAANVHINETMAEASAEIAQALGGYVLKTRNELFIMNTDDISTATSVWRWNTGGLGYWSGQAGHALDPGAQYTIAITSSGTINADVLRGRLLESVEINAILGHIGEWEISPEGIYKVVADSNDPTKVYRVRLYPPSAVNTGSSKVLSFETSTNSGASFDTNFVLNGNGQFVVYTDNTDGAEGMRVVYRNDPLNHNARLNANGVHLYRDWGDSYGEATQSHLYSVDLEFRDENGNILASYPGDGWKTFEMPDSYVVGQKTVWKYLINGYHIMAACRRTFSNVVVNQAWGAIYCGTNGGYTCNFMPVAYPHEFDSPPTVVAQVEATKDGNDGWLVTNALNIQSNPNQFLPAYDLARGTAITVPSISVNYFVFGKMKIVEPTRYTISKSLTNVTSSNAATSVQENQPYVTRLTATNGSKIQNVTVTMDGVDITDQVWTPDIPSNTVGSATVGSATAG